MRYYELGKQRRGPAMSLKVAIFGTGEVARKSYLPQLAKCRDITLSYFNRTREKAVKIAEQYGGWVADSPAELMADEPDTVLVLTRENQRYDAAMTLLEFKPKRLFFEKPLVAQRDQANVVEDDFFKAKEILQRAQEQGTETAMVFNYRFFDQTRRAKRIIDERDFGCPKHVTGLVHYACWSHCIDLIMHFCGPIAEVTALRSRDGSSGAYAITAAFRLDNDATGTIIGTNNIHFNLPLYELTFAFAHGRLSTRDLDGDLEVLDYRTNMHEVYGLSRINSRWDQYQASFGKSLHAYLESIRQGSPPPVPGIAGLYELQFEAALKRSIAQQRPVNLAEEFPIELPLTTT
ncbi:MAG: Gfo/Idh/MocA family oxidoreductase [Firmicutes bacterium]|nr:Gfo/Idh/MocA family oxidoreductase [Bacillota bacterium]